MTRSCHTVIIWGAGATASLGFGTTAEQAKTLRELAFNEEERPLSQRISEALGEKAYDPWSSALSDLLTILGDGGKDGGFEKERNLFTVTSSAMKIMGKHAWRGADEDQLRNRILSLRLLYDWPALKNVINVCPGVERGDLKLNDLFNILDMHGQSGHGFPEGDGKFLAPQRVLSARNALKMLQQTKLYIDWQFCRDRKREDLKRHYDFAEALGRRAQRQGMELARGSMRFDHRAFYMGDVSFACFNWDPIALWCQFVANRHLNTSSNVPHVGSPARRLRIFHDLGHFMSGPRVEDDGRGEETPWHPMNESSALQLNDDDHGSAIRVRISKFLLPHGCLWWRECPNCGKLVSYMGDAWEIDSPTLIPPPPLRAFVRDMEFRSRSEKERKECERGRVDARTCVHCGELTYAHHTQTIMQSSFKDAPPPSLDEIKRDLRVAVQGADHIVLMGYTLPPDDVDYRAFLSARRRRDPERPVRCSVVVGTKYGGQWFGPSEWPALRGGMKHAEPPHTTLGAASDLFGEDNVRFYGGGIPDVFLDGGVVTDTAVGKLLTWE